MAEKFIDMHMHTTYSDGELTPDELINLAIENNIAVMSITDHNTIDGMKQVDRNKEYIRKSGIEIINGIELTAKVPKGRMHILGYDYDINNHELNNIMDKLKDDSISRFLSILEQVKRDYGINFHYTDIQDLINATHNLGRPDLAKLLVKYDFAGDINEAFDKYLNPANDKIRGINKGLNYQECFDIITNSGGIPVIAHPKTLKLSNEEFENLLSDMIDKGLRGIEVYHSTHTQEEINYYKKIAEKYGLLISGGSDFHGKSKPEINIGTGINNNLKIKKLSLIDEIRKRNGN